jgi:hypothetical protein
VEQPISYRQCFLGNEGSEDGSEAVGPNADIAQLVEQVIRNDQVVGSNPTIGLFPLERGTEWQAAHGAGNVPVCQSEPADAFFGVHLVGNACSMQTVRQRFRTL